jgi:hypothetical protein
MKKDKTFIGFVLDRSGSMESIRDDTIGGFNAFVEEQKRVAGECTMTLLQFDDRFETPFADQPIHKVRPLTRDSYVPRASTALLDAIGKMITETGARLKALPEDERPEKVVIVILTDGYENASREYTAARINEMIAHQRDVYRWEFTFLGANQDAITSAAALGIPAHSSVSFASSGAGVSNVVRSMSANIASYRFGTSANVSYSDEDRDAAMSDADEQWANSSSK